MKKKTQTQIYICPSIMICGINRKHCALFVFGNARWIVKSETSNFMELSLKTEKHHFPSQQTGHRLVALELFDPPESFARRINGKPSKIP